MTLMPEANATQSTFALNIPDMIDCLRGLIAQVPKGRVTTYGRLAEALGDIIAARWVGHFALHHCHDHNCNCHRIVRSTGQLGLYTAGNSTDKANLLMWEGVQAKLLSAQHSTQADPIVDLPKYVFDNFQTTKPLASLRTMQHDLAARVRLTRRSRVPRLVGGVDVSYGPEGHAAAAYALVDSRDNKLVWSTTVRRKIEFPYITTYLTFRELPILLDLLREVRRAGRSCPVLLVDGTGVLHPRRAGIASYLGVAADQPTVGVIKKQLCGRVDLVGLTHLESRTIMLDDRPVGAAIRPIATGDRVIFVSPGHRVDADFAVELVRRMLSGRRLPDPLYYADRISRAAARE